MRGAALTGRDKREGDGGIAMTEDPDVSAPTTDSAETILPSITARLLAIAAIAEAEKTAPMLTIARAALMDAAKLIERKESRADDGEAELTLEDLLEEREARLRAHKANQPGPA